MTVKMEHHTARKYSSPTRERQASQTRTNILDATQRLLMDRGYAKTTIEAIAQEAGVAKQTVYAVFQSKRGIVAGLLDRAMLTERLYELCDRSLETANVHEALRLTAQLVLQVHESRSPVFDLLRGAGVLDRNSRASKTKAAAATGANRKCMCVFSFTDGGSRTTSRWKWRSTCSGASPAGTCTECSCRNADGPAKPTPSGSTKCSSAHSSPTARSTGNSAGRGEAKRCCV